MSGLSNRKFSEVAEIYSGIMLNENQNQLPGSSGSNPKPPRNYDPRTSFRSGVKSSFGLDPAKPTMSQIGGKMKGYAGRALGGVLRNVVVEPAKMPLRIARWALKRKPVQAGIAVLTTALGADAMIRGKDSILHQVNPFKGSDLNQYQSFEMSGEPLSEEVLVEVHNEIWSYVVTKLVEEKYAPDVEAAQKMAEHISDDWFFTLIDENSIMEELNG